MPTIVWKGNPALFTAGVNTVLVEQPDSPQYVFSQSPICTRKFRGLHSLCLSSAVGAGTVGSGDMAGWIVQECAVNRQPKQIGELIIKYGAGGGGGSGITGGAVLPPDEFDLDPFEVNPKLERHPFFDALTDDDREKARDAANQIAKSLRDSADATLSALGKSLTAKLRRGQETYYLAGLTYSWTQYSLTLPSSISMGGQRETPGGPLAGILNTTDFSWLRQADKLNFDGSKYKVTSFLMGAPNGHWDPDLT